MSYLNIIKDLEYNLDCSGVCETPRFWFFKDFMNGPPSDYCISSLKDKLDESDGVLGYCFTAIGFFIFMQMQSLCGICRSKDKQFQEPRNDFSRKNKGEDNKNFELVDEPSQIDGDIYGKGQMELPNRAKRY